MCFTLLPLVSYLVYHVLRATAAQGLSCLIELWLPLVVERSNFILRGEFCKPRYVTEEGGNLARKVCVREPGVELTGILKGVYVNLLPYFPRKCSWSWVPNLGLLENSSSTAKCHSSFCAYLHAISLLSGWNLLWDRVVFCIRHLPKSSQPISLEKQAQAKGLTETAYS